MSLNNIKEKLGQLMALNENGSYTANDPLPIEEIESFEKKHDLSLPTDYKEFISEFVNGCVGPGPDRWLWPLNMWNSVHPSLDLGTVEAKLSEPFLLTKKWHEIDSDIKLDYDEAINGTIRLCHIGCANFIFLVVKGKEIGNIWIDDRASTGEILPYGGEKRKSFTEWYIDWLDGEIRFYEEKYNLSLKPTNNDKENDKAIKKTNFWTKLKRLWS